VVNTPTINPITHLLLHHAASFLAAGGCKNILFSAIIGPHLLLIKPMYWFKQFKDGVVSKGFTICPDCPVLFTKKI
jgi:hypothetical protein